MSTHRSQYTLYYTMAADNAIGSFPYMREADNLIEALSTAWATRHAGDTITAIAYKDQIILGGKTLQEILDTISKRGANLNNAATDIVQQLIPELLPEELYKLNATLQSA